MPITQVKVTTYLDKLQAEQEQLEATLLPAKRKASEELEQEDLEMKVSLALKHPKF